MLVSYSTLGFDARPFHRLLRLYIAAAPLSAPGHIYGIAQPQATPDDALRTALLELYRLASESCDAKRTIQTRMASHVAAADDADALAPVSYTHLTLPTKA